MTPIWLAALLCAPLRAGDLIHVDFGAGQRMEVPALNAAWAPALNSIFKSDVPRSGWPGGLYVLSRMDLLDPRNARSFEPLLQALAAEGLSPKEFARVPAHQRSEAAARAFAVAQEATVKKVEAERARVSGLVQAKDERGALEAAVTLLQTDEAGAPYLPAGQRGKTVAAIDAVKALQTEYAAKKALSRLALDAELLFSRNPLEDALKEEPAAAAGSEGASVAPLIKFDPSARKDEKREPPKIELRPGQNFAAVVQGMIHGLPYEEASKLGLSAPREDFGTRFAAALDLAREKAKLAGYSADQVYFGEARMPLGSRAEGWDFDFYALKEPKARSGHVVRVLHAEKGRKPSLVPLTAEFASVPEDVHPFPLRPDFLRMGFKFSVNEARRFLGEAVPPAEVGLSVVVTLVEEPQTGAKDYWYRFVDANREYGRFNARDGSRVNPIPKDSPLRPARWSWLDWLRGLLRL